VKLRESEFEGGKKKGNAEPELCQYIIAIMETLELAFADNNIKHAIFPHFFCEVWV
jgi:hypothetical protein